MALAPVEHGGVGPYWSALRAPHLVFRTLCDPTNETHIRTHQKRLRRDGGRPKQGGHHSCIQTHIYTDIWRTCHGTQASNDDVVHIPSKPVQFVQKVLDPTHAISAAAGRGCTSHERVIATDNI